jgi:hypothetical protein
LHKINGLVYAASAKETDKNRSSVVWNSNRL